MTTEIRQEVASVSPVLPEVGFVRLGMILAIIPVGKSTWWAGVRTGRFPRPVKLGPRTTAWRVGDIRRLIDNVEGKIDTE